MPWMRPPQWLYPQPLTYYPVEDAVANHGAKKLRRASEGNIVQEAGCTAAAAATQPAPVDESQVENCGGDASTTYKRSDATNFTILRSCTETATVDNAAVVQAVPTAAARDEEHDEIRGRGTTPGASSSDGAPPAIIRGPDGRPGGQHLSGCEPSAAQRRLDRRNWHLRTSLQLHAERVNNKRSHAQTVDDGLSAAERLDALRRRIALREQSRQGGVAVRDVGRGRDAIDPVNRPSTCWTATAADSCTQPETGATGHADRQDTSNEDGKMHSTRVHVGRIRSTACTGRSSAEFHNAAEESGLHGAGSDHDSGMQEATPPAAAAAAAARYVAWHSSSVANAPAAGR
jgi:hypothetical protein